MFFFNCAKLRATSQKQSNDSCKSIDFDFLLEQQQLAGAPPAGAQQPVCQPPACQRCVCMKNTKTTSQSAIFGLFL
jgi:hypothetical protein